MHNLSNKQIIGWGALTLAVVIAIPAVADFGSKSVSVSATIENALSVSNLPINFGTIQKDEQKQQPFNVSLSDAFVSQSEVSGVDYRLTLEHAPLTPDQQQIDGQAAHEYCANEANFPDTAGWNSWGKNEWNAFLADEYFQRCALPLCPFIERIAAGDVLSIDASPSIPANVQSSRGFFDALAERGVTIPALRERPTSDTDQDVSVRGPVFPVHNQGMLTYQPAFGTLTNTTTTQDTSDVWTFNLLPPCFSAGGLGCNSSQGQQVRTLPSQLGGNAWSCVARVEVTAIDR